MSEDTRRQLFEPFFTTKERGHGTGLGLATVYGAVKQNGGSIWVESERGSGTTVRIYLPAVPGVPHTPFEENTAARSLRGTETILVVDDRADVRGFVREVLQRQGYTVIEAANPRETLGLLPTVGERVKLLIVDFGLPQMDGRRLARLCRDLQPHLRVLYMSGNPPEGALAPGLTFVQKPLESRAFLETVRTALDAPANMV